MQKLILALSIGFLFTQQAISQTLQDKEVEVIVSRLVEKMNNSGVKNITVADFTDLTGNSTVLGSYLAEEFSLALSFSDANFKVVDRSKINLLLEEAGLAEGGLINPNTVAKLGNVEGITAIVSGSLTSIGDYVRVIVKVLDLETASIISGVRGDLSKNPTIVELEGKKIKSNSQKSIRSDTRMSSTEDSPAVQASELEISSEYDNINFEITDCFLKQDKLTIKFNATSLKGDKYLRLNSKKQRSRAFDNFGTEYAPTNIRIANSEGQSLNKSIIAGITTSGEITFSNVRKDASFVALLNITDGECFYSHRDCNYISFRNIPINKK